MSASWKIASMVVLPFSLALAGVGCVAQADEDQADDEMASVGASAENETTGEATDAFGCGGGFGCGGFGRGFGFGFHGGPFLGAPYCGTPFYGASPYGCGGGYPGFYGGYGYGGYGGYGGCGGFGYGRRFGGGCF